MDGTGVHDLMSLWHREGMLACRQLFQWTSNTCVSISMKQGVRSRQASHFVAIPIGCLLVAAAPTPTVQHLFHRDLHYIFQACVHCRHDFVDETHGLYTGAVVQRRRGSWH
jgi:hypothetical protein